MVDLSFTSAADAREARATGVTESRATRWVLMALAFAFLAVFLLLPLVLVFAEAFKRGWGPYFETLVDPDTISAIRLTLLVAAIAVPLNPVS